MADDNDVMLAAASTIIVAAAVRRRRRRKRSSWMCDWMLCRPQYGTAVALVTLDSMIRKPIDTAERMLLNI